MAQTDSPAVVTHGVCRGTWVNERGQKRACTKRTQLWLPAKLCEKCLMREQARLVEQQKAVIAELERLEEEDG